MGFALGPKAVEAGYRLHAYETIGSTSTEALARAKAGDEGRLWVVARAQTAGHGRRGRPWETPDGNLAASLLIGGSVPPIQSARLGFVAGLALVDAIEELALGLAEACAKPSHCGERVAAKRLGEGLLGAGHDSENPSPSSSPQGGGGQACALPRLRLKWPNDVLLDGAKLAGILLQAVSLPGGRSRVVVGMGVNVEHAPEGLPYPATSLAASGAAVTAEQVFGALSDAWVEQERLWDEGRGFPAIRRRWLERAAGLGASITVRMGDEVFRGAFETIDEEGRLVVRAANGSATTVTAGDVHFGAAATTGN